MLSNTATLFQCLEESYDILFDDEVLEGLELKFVIFISSVIYFNGY